MRLNVSSVVLFQRCWVFVPNSSQARFTFVTGIYWLRLCGAFPSLVLLTLETWASQGSLGLSAVPPTEDLGHASILLSQVLRKLLPPRTHGERNFIGFSDGAIYLLKNVHKYKTSQPSERDSFFLRSLCCCCCLPTSHHSLRLLCVLWM